MINSSPLIVLGKISNIELLARLNPQIVILEGVATEINGGSSNDPARIWLEQTGFKFIKKGIVVPPVISAWDLGAGESEVIAWAYLNSGNEVIVDDQAARKCAQMFNIHVRGTMGILLLAKKRGLLQKIKPLLEDLAKSGLYIRPNLGKTILELAGEV